MESAASTISRARRILNGAKARQKESWDELFQAADKDRSRLLDVKELKLAALAAFFVGRSNGRWVMKGTLPPPEKLHPGRLTAGTYSHHP
eukprot:symbB.v1.2.001282.t1/scaffold68.1/size354569/4